MRRNVVSICDCSAGFFLTRRRNARSNLGVGTSSLMAHLVLRKLAMRLSADWLLSLPARKALMAVLASAAVSCRHASMRRWRSRLSSISCSSAGKASASVSTRSKVKVAISSIRLSEFSPFARQCQVIFNLSPAPQSSSAVAGRPSGFSPGEIA